jgi:hypothetical protein
LCGEWHRSSSDSLLECLPNEPFVKFIDFATRRVIRIMRLERKLAKTLRRGLALSPDAGSLLCTLIENERSDLVLVENFR